RRENDPGRDCLPHPPGPGSGTNQPVRTRARTRPANGRPSGRPGRRTSPFGIDRHAAGTAHAHYHPTTRTDDRSLRRAAIPRSAVLRLHRPLPAVLSLRLQLRLQLRLWLRPLGATFALLPGHARGAQWIVFPARTFFTGRVPLRPRIRRPLAARELSCDSSG